MLAEWTICGLAIFFIGRGPFSEKNSGRAGECILFYRQTGWFLLTFLRVFASICVPIEIATDLLTRFEREMPTAAERKRMELLFLAYRYNKSQGDYRDQTNRPRLQLGSLPRFPKLESPWVGQ